MLDKKIAVIGAGKLGEALITGMIDAGIVKKSQFVATAAHKERLDIVSRKLGVKTTLSNGEAVRSARLVLLCVKPQTVEEVLRQISDDLTPRHLLISVAASVSTKFMEDIIGKPVPVIRVMPNTPCLIKEGMSGIAPGKHATPEHLNHARRIFDAIGRSITVDEKHMDAVTGLSASGPAFVYIMIESFIEGGVKVG
jgi:pyrroline-5-carboxylate reductase